MSLLLDRSEADASCNSLPGSPRLRLLVAVHLVLGLAPVAGILIPPDIRLVITSAAAVVLGLTRGARSGDPRATDWHTVAIYVLLAVVFVLNSLCAARATLATGRIGLSVSLVCIVAVLLGVAEAAALRQDTFTVWWVFPCSVLANVVSALVIIASLLVVRSCGYRLIPRQMALAEEPRT